MKLLFDQYQNLMLKKVGLGLLALGAGAKFYQSYTESYIFTRNLRTVRCGIHILYAYKIAFNEQNYLDIHESIAKDIYETCIENDGLYVKFGQGIATMDNLLPPPYFKHMSKLQDKAKATSYEKIKQVFKEDLGRDVDEVFLEFEKEPIASASLAQVHKAKLKNGTEVAVKIQKPNIRKQFKSDMMMHYLINWVLEKAFDLPLVQFVDDIQENLRKQLDFKNEQENAIKGMKNFQKLKREQLYVPTPYPQFTTHRVMVSQWIDGFKITDNDKMSQYKFNKGDVMHDLIRAFAEQIFVTGFIHCDPHPGNILVRPNPLKPSTHQLVILDFGLSLEISQKFRLQYSNFWKSMFSKDQQGMKQVCEQWGMKYTDAFAGWQLMRPYSKEKLLTKKVSNNDVIRMQLQMKGKIKQIMQDTINFPKELLFISRNMNLVRSLNKFYGGVAPRIPIMAQAAYIGTTFQNSHTVNKSVRYYYERLKFHCGVLMMELIDWFMRIFEGKNLENYVEDETLKRTHQMFQSYGFKPISAQTYNA